MLVGEKFQTVALRHRTATFFGLSTPSFAATLGRQTCISSTTWGRWQRLTTLNTPDTKAEFWSGIKARQKIPHT